MDKVEFNLADLKELLVSVYKKAVNSYHDLSEIIAEQAIAEFINQKKKPFTASLIINDEKVKTDTTLCPTTYNNTTWNTVSFQEDFVSNYVPLPFSDSLPHFGNYNNYSLATTNTISVVTTTDSTN
jgi:hypothetical protein